jgi:diguanylate cyclase (GGDEF)-like protein
MRASSLARSSGRKARVIATTAPKLIAISQSKSASLTCSKVPPRATPALLTSRSTRPCSASSAAGSAATAARSATSIAWRLAWPPSASTCAAVSGQAGAVDVGEGETAAAAREGEGDGAADAAAGAGDPGRRGRRRSRQGTVAGRSPCGKRRRRPTGRRGQGGSHRATVCAILLADAGSAPRQAAASANCGIMKSGSTPVLSPPASTMSENADDAKLASARRSLALLNAQADAVRADLAGLRRELAQVKDELSQLRSLPALQANAELVEAAVHADTAAQTAVSSLDELARSTQHDELTGAPTRALMLDRLDNAISMAQRRSTRVGVIFLDLDHFKQINDSLGHAVGDLVLQLATRRLEDAVRESDSVSRHGGDEFVVLLAEMAKASDAAAVARKIIDSLAVPAEVGPHTLSLSGSLGISIYPEDGADPVTLINCADAAMYRAKKAGPGRYAFCSEIVDRAGAEVHAPPRLRSGARAGRIRPSPSTRRACASCSRPIASSSARRRRRRSCRPTPRTRTGGRSTSSPWPRMRCATRSRRSGWRRRRSSIRRPTRRCAPASTR